MRGSCYSVRKFKNIMSIKLNASVLKSLIDKTTQEYLNLRKSNLI